jgi:hypothetical protein
MTRTEIREFLSDAVTLHGSDGLQMWWDRRFVTGLPDSVCQRFIDRRYNLLEDVRRGSLAYYDFQAQVEQMALDLVYDLREEER